MTNAAMQLKNVKKRIGKKEIIKGLSFDIKKGEVFGFLGPNGAGKTTTIRMMVGLMSITEGEILIQGKSIKTNFKEAIQEVGGIVENPELYPFMSGWQNLKHFARMIPNIKEERIKEVISLVGLEKAIHEKAGRYSLGMRQRLGIAQALLHNPSILILDEPTNGLDPAGIREIRQYIRNLAEKEQVSVIVSSHLLSEIELMCDRIGVIKNGSLIAIQDIKEESQNNEQITVVKLVATPLEQAVNILKNDYPNITQKENHLLLEVVREEIPAILKLLLNQDIAVYEVETMRTTLEDKFFDLIGENVIE
ncbi:ABC transporter ATP-binding protein [Alkalihalobacillus trypoxylicola]|uniref:Bacitracin ABC transporter ATP-binding protein n=1 Tax=Alkalihalobacillus trypoxylicola TaxID=519424 RepID=A0A162CN12_9BACI|nr:ABC transporter ATP-binding protein [Alkalihalobacillus trypoxylicola]KYG25614.1 bacitracin ABC transporter ATP-binding protein [Alkalihalobacillus trypoxylicola]